MLLFSKHVVIIINKNLVWHAYHGYNSVITMVKVSD